MRAPAGVVRLLDSGRCAAPRPTSHLERPMNAKNLILTAGVALVVVLAYDKSRGKIPALKIGA